jgi:phosphopantothenoylcysteine decarboxylase/phosphopantothenate--cysteine ligase
LKNKKVLITSGPTHEHIDEIRYITNRSSGKQGTEIAKSLSETDADVTLVTGPVNLDLPKSCKVIQVETAIEMQDAVINSGEYDIVICVAAVGDWRSKHISPKKIKKKNGECPPKIELIENPDILKTICNQNKRPELVIGFAAETDDIIENSRKKLQEKGCDWIFANKVTRETGNMGGNENELLLIKENEMIGFKKSDKREIAKLIRKEIIKQYSGEKNKVTKDFY